MEISEDIMKLLIQTASDAQEANSGVKRINGSILTMKTDIQKNKEDIILFTNANDKIYDLLRERSDAEKARKTLTGNITENWLSYALIGITSIIVTLVWVQFKQIL